MAKQKYILNFVGNYIIYMRKLILTLTLIFSTFIKSYSADITDYIKGDYSSKADSLEYCFIENFMNKNKGTFWSTPNDIAQSSWNIYWQQAHAMDIIVYAYERLKDTNPEKALTYKNYIHIWYTNHANNYYGATFENPFTDDMAWICLTLLHIGEALEATMYTNMAKTVYDKYIITRAITDANGFHLPWNTDKNPDGSYKNPVGGSCTDGPSCLVAAKLYEKFGDEKYLNDAKALYQYTINNTCYTDGRVGEPPLTYTNGTFGEACRHLYHITKENEYRQKAALFIYFPFTSTCCTTNGILRNEGENMDNSIFKAVLMPYACNFVLDEDMSLFYRQRVLQLMQKNADTLWSLLALDKYPNIYCPFYWGEPYNYSSTVPASMGAMASGASLYENVTRMHSSLLKAKEMTGINVIHSNDIVSNNQDIYNITGQKVANSYKGIVISNKKKAVKQ